MVRAGLPGVRADDFQIAPGAQTNQRVPCAPTRVGSAGHRVRPEALRQLLDRCVQVGRCVDQVVQASVHHPCRRPGRITQSTGSCPSWIQASAEKELMFRYT
jgi:hypothetical protein